MHRSRWIELPSFATAFVTLLRGRSWNTPLLERSLLNPLHHGSCGSASALLLGIRFSGVSCQTSFSSRSGDPLRAAYFCVCSS